MNTKTYYIKGYEVNTEMTDDLVVHTKERLEVNDVLVNGCSYKVVEAKELNSLDEYMKKVESLRDRFHNCEWQRGYISRNGAFCGADIIYFY